MDKIDESFTLVALLLLCVTGKAERYCASNAFASVTIQNRTFWAAQHSKMAFLTSLGVNLTARNAMNLNSLGFRPVVSQATPFTVSCDHVSLLHTSSITKHHHASTKCWPLLVVVWLSWLSDRALVATAGLFTLLYFRLITSKFMYFQLEARCS